VLRLGRAALAPCPSTLTPSALAFLLTKLPIASTLVIFKRCLHRLRRAQRFCPRPRHPHNRTARCQVLRPLSSGLPGSSVGRPTSSVRLRLLKRPRTTQTPALQASSSRRSTVRSGRWRRSASGFGRASFVPHSRPRSLPTCRPTSRPPSGRAISLPGESRAASPYPITISHGIRHSWGRLRVAQEARQPRRARLRSRPTGCARPATQTPEG
jgi:hypothetical protein